MKKKSVSSIVSESSEAIVQVIPQDYNSPPETGKQWKNITQEFGDPQQFPHVVGAKDRKHVVNEATAKSSFLYLDCNEIFSIFLLAMCNAKYNFTLIDVSQYGSNNDSGVLRNQR